MTQCTIEEWNGKHSIGTAVKHSPDGDTIFTTRSKAQSHSCGRPQIWLVEKVGSFNLSDIEPVNTFTY